MRIGTLFKMGKGALMGNIFARKSPLNVMLSVTNRCPSDCSYCNIPSRKQRELSTKEILKLIDEITDMGTQRLGIWGGEPLVRDDIGEIIDYAKKKGLFVTMDSNGYFFPQKIKLLKNLDHLILSLDGPEEVHDLNREPGSFKKVISAIEVGKGEIACWTVTVLTKNNLDSIDFILNKAREYGFLTTFQILHHNDKLSRNHKTLLPSSEAYKRTIKKLILEKKKGAPIASSMNYLYHILNWPDYKIINYPYQINNLKCWAGRLYCNIDTDGSVYPCSLLTGNVKALNFLEVGFKKAFDNLQENYCKSCLASCFTEYNYLYSLNIRTIAEWLKSII